MATIWQDRIPLHYSLERVQNSIHVDLGCGSLPRNPLKAKKVVGIDVFVDAPFGLIDGFLDYVRIAQDAQLPFESNQIDSISAFDFLEHIPRNDRLPNGEFTNPLINIMNEIHRILKPGGIFIALTPCFPSPAAFTDPTHVNFISDQTHLYFAGPNFAKAKNYGFTGEFDVIEAAWSDWRGALWDSSLNETQKTLESTKKASFKYSREIATRLKRKLRKRLQGHSGETHFLWVLQKPAVKN
jgi:SAM-dependent methyltransferase